MRLLLFKIMHNLGYCAYQLGNLEDSELFYRNARSTCIDAKLGCEHLAATDVALAVLLFHTSLCNMDTALRLFKSTLPIYWTKYGVSKQVGTLLNNIGRTHYMLGNYAEAALTYENSLGIRLKCLKRDSADVAATVCNAGRAYHQQGNFDKAIERYEEFLEWSQRHPEADQRDVVIISKCLVEIFRARGDHAKAKAACENALTVGKAALGLYHPEVASACYMLASLLYETEDYDRSLHYYIESLYIEKALLHDGCHKRILDILSNVAQIHRHRQDPLLAFLVYAEIYGLQVQLYGPNSLVLAVTLSDMGLMEYHMAAYTASLALYQAALSIQRDHYGSDDHLCIAATLNSIGLVLYFSGDHSLARNCFVQGLKIRTKLLGSDHHDVAVSWYNVGTVYLKTGYDDLAIKFYTEALRIERFAPDVSDPDTTKLLTLNYLGCLHQERGEIEQALDYFSEALEAERTRTGNAVIIGKLLNLIGNIHLRCGNISSMMQCYTEAARLLRGSGMGNEALIISGINYYGLSKLHPPCAAQA
jgi:tetratricopeptide (TPR) repeat protein